MVPYIVAEFEVISYAEPVFATMVAEDEELLEDDVVSALAIDADCWELLLILFKLSQSQKLACAEPTDKKTARNTVKKPMKTIFLKSACRQTSLKILSINYFNY